MGERCIPYPGWKMSLPQLSMDCKKKKQNSGARHVVVAKLGTVLG
jgi:hypothetical protein